MPTTLDPANKNVNATLSNGNLTVTTSPSAYSTALSTTSKSSGKWYFEATVNAIGGTTAFTFGVARSLPSGNEIGAFAGQVSFAAFGPGFLANGTTKATGTSASNGQVIGVAIDFTNTNVWIFVPGSGLWNNTVGDNPATNTGGLNDATWFNGGLTSAVFGSPLFAGLSVFNSSQLTINFGASAYAHAIPAGFQSWDPTTAQSSGMFFGAP